MPKVIADELKKGARNIEVRVSRKGLILPIKPNSIAGLNYPDANIKITGYGLKVTDLIPEGIEFKKSLRVDEHRSIRGERYWVMPYKGFDINDIVVDENGNEVLLREEVEQVTGDIFKVENLEFRIESGANADDVWKFKIDLPDLSEQQCQDFYVMITRDWTSARHKVVKVQDGWLYYHLDSEELHSDRNPNVDWTQYRVRPRYRLINCPVSKGLHITNGKIYVPWKYKKIRVCKGGSLVHVYGCRLNSLEITGFKLNGLGRCPIGVYHSVFTTGMFVHHNSFCNLSHLAICAHWNEKVVFCDNTINNTRVGVIECGGKNNTIARNKFNNIGWMLNTRAISGRGDRLHICDNVIEDFCYAAISCGSRAATRDSVILNFIIERNYVRLTKGFTDNILAKTLADCGGIFFGPSCTQGIIRDNIVVGMNGISSNRGIFLDDGAKNVSIYGNLIMGTKNSYDIDLRLCSTFSKDIPDYNTNNNIFHNIMTGYYRFQDRGINSHCVGGQNIQLLSDSQKKTIVNVENYASDIIVDGVELDGKIQILKRQSYLLDSLKVSEFIRKAIEVN